MYYIEGVVIAVFYDGRLGESSSQMLDFETLLCDIFVTNCYLISFLRNFSFLFDYWLCIAR